MTEACGESGYARAILTNYHVLTERQYVGDIDAIVTLLDFAEAVERAKLTDRQAEALRLVYGEGMTQKDAGKALGIKQDAVSHLVRRATASIQKQYEKGAK